MWWSRIQVVAEETVEISEEWRDESAPRLRLFRTSRVSLVVNFSYMTSFQGLALDSWRPLNVPFVPLSSSTFR